MSVSKMNGIDQDRIQRAFSFNPIVVNSIQSQIDFTPNTEHFYIALDYRDSDQFRAHVKRIPEETKSNGTLGDSINVFFGDIKDSNYTD